MTSGRSSHPRPAPRSHAIRYCRLDMLQAVILTLLLTLAAHSAIAQQGESSGLHAAIRGTAVHLDQADRDAGWDSGVELVFGYRFDQFLHRLYLPPSVRIGVDVSTAITALRGKADDDAFAYGDLALGLRASLRTGPVRPYVLARHGRTNIERDERSDSTGAAQLYNLSATGPSYGMGIEVPFRRSTMGRGIDVGVLQTRGRYDQAERGNIKYPRDVGFTAWRIYLGYSGLFTGTDPFR
jgi:hypothetical protein